MKRVETTVLAELPLPVLALVALAHAAYDTEANTPIAPDYNLLAYGVTVGVCLWTVTNESVKLNESDRFGVPCVRLSKREGFHTAEPQPQVDYYLPFTALRKPVGIELTLLEEEP